MADSKPAKKKRRSRTGKKSGEEPGTRFTIEEDVGMSTSVEPTVSASSNYPVDPIAELKKQISGAKASKDHVRAQELRNQLWVLQDTVLLGKTGAGAPPVDVTSVLTPKKSPTELVEGSPSTMDPMEKKLLKLRKKLEQIEVLKQKQCSGATLEKNQLSKIEAKSEVEKEITILEDLLRTNVLM